jgi:hypothetical protein
MDATEQAIDQMARLAFTGAEYTLKITGTGAKHLISGLWSVAKNTQRTRGKARLESLLNSGEELKVLSIRQGELKTFAGDAKRYGVLYALIKGVEDAPDSLTDVIVKAKDADLINRIVEKLDYGRFDETQIVVEATRELEDAEKAEADKGVVRKDTNELLDDMLAVEKTPEAQTAPNPTAAKTESPSPSEPSSKADGSQQDQDGTAPGTTAESSADTKADASAKSKTRDGSGFADGRERQSVKVRIDDKRKQRSEQSQSKDTPTKAAQTRHQAPRNNRRKTPRKNNAKGR